MVVWDFFHQQYHPFIGAFELFLSESTTTIPWMKGVAIKVIPLAGETDSGGNFNNNAFDYFSQPPKEEHLTVGKTFWKAARIPPWNLTNWYPKWRHVWSRRYIFQGPSFLVSMLHSGGVNPNCFFNIPIALLSVVYLSTCFFLNMFFIMSSFSFFIRRAPTPMIKERPLIVGPSGRVWVGQ